MSIRSPYFFYFLTFCDKIKLQHLKIYILLAINFMYAKYLKTTIVIESEPKLKQIIFVL